MKRARHKVSRFEVRGFQNFEPLKPNTLSLTRTLDHLFSPVAPSPPASTAPSKTSHESYPPLTPRQLELSILPYREVGARCQ